MASFDNTGYPPVFLKEKFYRVLESREGSLLAIANILYGPGTEVPPNSKIYKLVLKYESQHFRISLGRWKKIFQQLGCLEEYNGIMESFNCPSANAGNDNRSPGNNGDIKKEPVPNDGDDEGQTIKEENGNLHELLRKSQDEVKTIKEENGNIHELLRKSQDEVKTITEEKGNIHELLRKSQDEVKTIKEENGNLHELLRKSQDEVKAKELEETKVRDQQRKLEQKFDKQLETLNFELTKQQEELQQQHDERCMFLEMHLIKLLQEKDKQFPEKWHQIACNVVKASDESDDEEFFDALD